MERGKYGILGMLAVYAGETEAKTMILELKDCYSGMRAKLHYGVLEELDVITRRVKFVNGGKESTVL